MGGDPPFRSKSEPGSVAQLNWPLNFLRHYVTFRFCMPDYTVRAALDSTVQLGASPTMLGTAPTKLGMPIHAAVHSAVKLVMPELVY